MRNSGVGGWVRSGSGTKRGEVIISEVRAAVSGWRKTGGMLGMTTGELDDFAEAFQTGDQAAVT